MRKIISEKSFTETHINNWYFFRPNPEQPYYFFKKNIKHISILNWKLKYIYNSGLNAPDILSAQSVHLVASIWRHALSARWHNALQARFFMRRLNKKTFGGNQSIFVNEAHHPSLLKCIPRIYLPRFDFFFWIGWLWWTTNPNYFAVGLLQYYCSSLHIRNYWNWWLGTLITVRGKIIILCYIQTSSLAFKIWRE